VVFNGADRFSANGSGPNGSAPNGSGPNGSGADPYLVRAQVQEAIRSLRAELHI